MERPPGLSMSAGRNRRSIAGGSSGTERICTGESRADFIQSRAADLFHAACERELEAVKGKYANGGYVSEERTTSQVRERMTRRAAFETVANLPAHPVVVSIQPGAGRTDPARATSRHR